MIVSRSGRMAGSVSNGCVESAVFEEGRLVIESGSPKLVSYGVSDDTAFEAGLACGGTIEVLIQPLTEQHRQLLRLLEDDQPGVIRTNIQTGEVALDRVTPDEDAPFRHDDWFVEPYPRAPHLVIVGAIHIAIPLHRLAKVLGYRVTVVDARSRFASQERFPEADAIVVGWPDETLPALELDRSAAVTILTHDPRFDLPALRASLASSARYIGAIGSRRTNQKRFAALRAEGFSDAQLARVHGPIGLDLGGRSAEETALAILAEITSVRHSRSGAEMREARG